MVSGSSSGYDNQGLNPVPVTEKPSPVRSFHGVPALYAM